MEQKCLFKTLSGVDFTQSRAKLRMKINKVEQDIDVYVIRNNNFSYDLLLGLDAIKKFRLLQDESLNIYQKLDDGKIEQIRFAGINKPGEKKKIVRSLSMNTWI